MMNRLRRFGDLLGPQRLTALFLLLAITGLASLILNAVNEPWVVTVQSVLLLVFVGGAVGIIFSALDSFERGRWFGILTPAFGLVVLGTTVFQQQAGLFFGLAFGWIVAAQFIFNPRGPMAYQQAVKAMRKSDYETATKSLDALIRQEPKNPGHYRFRAEIHRLNGKFNAAKRDYKKLIELGPDHAAVGYNLLAEVHLQAGELNDALMAGRKAYELAPDEWVAAYNLCMVEDRLRMSEDALTHLDAAIQAGVPDARHRLLIHLYRARAAVRLGQNERAGQALNDLRHERRALNEWRKLLASDQAETLRAVIGSDVEAAERLIAGELDVSALGN